MNAPGPRPVDRVRAVRVVIAIGVIALAVLCVAAETIPSSSAGFLAKITNDTNTVATAPYFTCSDRQAADKSDAIFQYHLDEPSGSTIAADSSGHAANGTYQGGMTTSTTAPLACSHDAGGAYVLDGTTSYVSTPTSHTNPTTFSEEVWFKTTVAAGTLISLGNLQTGTPTMYDRMIYFNTFGQVQFGAYGTKYQIIGSAARLNDGAWHHVVATMSASTGMRLYVDGSLASSNASYTAPQNYTGYWRIGYQPLSANWVTAAGTGHFTGSMRYAAVYSTVLTAQQVRNRYTAGQVAPSAG